MTNYVNMENKTCIFGYGGIAVDVVAQSVIFQEIKPPMGAGTKIWETDGTKIGDWEFTGNKLCLRFGTLDEIRDICIMLTKIEKKQSGSFKFKDITFDFEMYKQESMDIIKHAMVLVTRNLTYLMAC